MAPGLRIQVEPTEPILQRTNPDLTMPILKHCRYTIVYEALGKVIISTESSNLTGFDIEEVDAATIVADPKLRWRMLRKVRNPIA